jgi:hypothetical protein
VKTITQEQVKQIVGRRKGSAPASKIPEELGLPSSTVNVVLSAKGLTRARPDVRQRDEERWPPGWPRIGPPSPVRPSRLPRRPRPCGSRGRPWRPLRGCLRRSPPNKIKSPPVSARRGYRLERPPSLNPSIHRESPGRRRGSLMSQRGPYALAWKQLLPSTKTGTCVCRGTPGCPPG